MLFPACAHIPAVRARRRVPAVARVVAQEPQRALFVMEEQLDGDGDVIVGAAQPVMV
jgi:hypothetical protein